MMRLKITLESDLCIYSGETYNSLVDQDVVFDDYGIPYIPAKRLKGCIREAFLEMTDLGVFDTSEYQDLFGKEGKSNSKFSLGNAYMENYDEMIEDIRGIEDSVIGSPQRVLDQFSYVRTQTALNENGSADDKSLRTMRVVKKGLIFYSDLFVDESVKIDTKNHLIDAIEMVKHIGLSRTRGLGLVKIQTEDSKDKTISAVTVADISVPEENGRLWYTINLEAPLLLKSVQGDQTKSMDYIEGAKILGLLAQHCGYECYKEKLSTVICSNAYIANGNKRAVPSMASLQKKKDQKYENGVLVCKNRLIAENIDEQMSPLGAKYLDEDGILVEVKKEINYHHKRPNDKSIGRATGKDDSAFYQLESVRKGQSFIGFIDGTKEQLNIIINGLKDVTEIRMGNSKSVEYGLVTMSLDEVTPKCELKSISSKDIYIKLNSSLIMYSEDGMLSSDIKDVEFYLSQTLYGVPDKVKVIDTAVALNFDMIGGFNTTWHRRKSTGTILGKGSILKVLCEGEIKIPEDLTIFIGERNSEGYGEVEIISDLTEDYHVRKETAKKVQSSDKTGIVKRLKATQHKYDIEEQAREKAREVVGSVISKPSKDATIAKLIIITQAEETRKAAKEQIDGIEKDSISALAKQIFSKAEDYSDDDYKIFISAYLRELKYLIRPAKEERRAGNE